MKKISKKYVIAVILLWVAVLAILIYQKSKAPSIDNEGFSRIASVSVKEDRVGAIIKLKEAIHGTDGIKYRYIVKTDCPSWDFETRYMTDTPIEWADGETSAVEVLIYDTQVRFDGTVYASGQYYTVPILGGISSEDISIEEWKQNLVKQAHQTYLSDYKKSAFHVLLSTLSVFLPLVLIFMMWYNAAVTSVDKKIKKAKENKEEA